MGTNDKVENKIFWDEKHDRSSCGICQCILKGCGGGLKPVASSSSSIAETIGNKVYSSSHGHLQGNTMFHGREQQAESICYGMKEEKKSQMIAFDTLCKDCFVATSSYYKEPDGPLQGIKDGNIEMKVSVKQLEKATDPFHLQSATRGNWWEGSLYY